MEEESHHIIPLTQVTDTSLADTVPISKRPMSQAFLHEQYNRRPMDVGHIPHAQTLMMNEEQDDDGQHQCQHHGRHNKGQNNHDGHQHDGRSHNRGPTGRSYSIIVFVYCLMIGNLLIHMFAFNNMYDGFTWYFAHIINIFISGMTAISYTITNVSQNSKAINVLDKKKFQKRQHIDPIYDLASKECQKCKNYKFPRVSHCSSCGSCIYKLDHHCVWTQNCIGLNNYKNFFLFISYGWMGAVQYQYNNWQYFWWCYNQPNGFWMQGTGWFYLFWVFMTINVTFMAIMISVLFFSHLFMAFTNTTTLESIKSKNCCTIPFFEWRKQYLAQINLYDRGEVKNILNVLGNSLFVFWFPYRVEMQNEIVPEKMNPQPIRTQVLQWDEKLRKAEFERQLKMRSLINSVKTLMKGKKIRVNDEIITL